MHRFLWGIAAITALADGIWAAAGHFDLDWKGYRFVGEIAALLAGLAFFYGLVRRDERLSAMLSGTAFLIVFSATFSVLNYMLLTIAGARMDAPLAAIDRMLGFDWIAVMSVMAHHPIVNFVLECCYNSVLPQIALTVLLVGWAGQPRDVFQFCLSVAVGASVTVFFWTLFPSFGAFSFYHLPPAVASHLRLALDGKYAAELVSLLTNGPGVISPQSARGLIGFPSFHAALAVMAAFYLSRIRAVRWPVILLNAGVIVATPIQGGHHLVDVIGGLGVAGLSIAVAGRITAAALKSAAGARLPPAITEPAIN